MSANSCPKVRKEIWKYIVSQNLIFSVEYSSGQVDCSCDNPAKCFRYESHIFFAQKPQTFNTVLLSTKKVFKCSSVDLQSKYRNTSDVFLSIVRKKFTQNPKTVSEVQTFSEFAFFILEVLLVIWITIAITLLIFFRTGEHFFAKTQKKRISLYFNKKKSSAPLQSRCGNSAEIFLAIVHKQFSENPETILKLHNFSGIGFLPIDVPLDFWTAIAATILKNFWQTIKFFWLKTQKLITRLFFFQKNCPPKSSSVHAKSTGKCAASKSFNNRP